MKTDDEFDDYLIRMMFPKEFREHKDMAMRIYTEGERDARAVIRDDIERVVAGKMVHPRYVRNLISIIRKPYTALVAFWAGAYVILSLEVDREKIGLLTKERAAEMNQEEIQRKAVHFEIKANHYDFKKKQALEKATEMRKHLTKEESK
jgi:hypothetical protein